MKPLLYENNLLDEISQNQNVLGVTAKGLGIHKTIGAWLDRYIQKLNLDNYGRKPYLIFLLHFNDEELLDIAQNQNLNIKKIQEGQNKQRGEDYLKGGIFAITAKVLVLDLLVKKVPGGVITGIIMAHAHKVLPMGSENFLLKIYRKENPTGFIKCFTDSPIALGSTFGKCEEVMKINFVDKIIICPRIRPDVQSSFDGSSKVKVFEYEVFMDKATESLHNKLIRLIEVCLNEFKGEVKQYKLDDNLFCIEEAIQTNFEVTLHLVMGKQINKLGGKAKQLVKDISNLKKLALKLLGGGSVSFLAHLCEVKNSHGEHSIFKSIDGETSTLIMQVGQLAKDRVFKINTGDVDGDDIMECLSDDSKEAHTQESKTHSESKNSSNTLKGQNNAPKVSQQTKKVKKRDLNLRKNWDMDTIATFSKDTKGYWEYLKKEFLTSNHFLKQIEAECSLGMVGDVCPKWDSVVKILEDINSAVEEEYSSGKRKNGYHPKKKAQPIKEFNKRKIMIVVKSERAKRDLERFIASYFLKKDQGKSVVELNFKNFLNCKDEKVRRREILTKSDADKDAKIEQFLLEKLYLTLGQKYNSYFKSIKDKMHWWKINREKELNEITLEMNEQEAKAHWDEFNTIGEENKGEQITEDAIAEADELAFKYDRVFDKCIIEVAYNFKYTEFDVFASHFDPDHIIIYDPALDIFRAAERYSAQRNRSQEEGPITIHCLYTKNSIEEFIFVNNVQREKVALLRLLEAKKNGKLIINLADAFEDEKRLLGKIKLERNLTFDEDALSKNESNVPVESWYLRKEIISIDMREFWSQIPHFLYSAGFMIIPIQLPIGDYILSDEIAVERKSVSTGDFQDSLGHGRLLDQIKNLNRFFKKPTLLIEFDESIAFRLKDKDIQSVRLDDIAPASIFTKLTILAMNFPKLFILWSENPLNTVEMFTKLKRKGGNPDLDRLSKLGKISNSKDHCEEGVLDLISKNSQSSDAGKFVPYEFLTTLPGVYPENVETIQKEIESIRELGEKTEQELIDLIGTKNGIKLFEFLHVCINDN